MHSRPSSSRRRWQTSRTVFYASRFSQIEVDRPVFITSLPRAGTTLLLEIVASLDAFTSHTYRDMPFLITPMLWHSISRPFQRPGTVVERAHGDGMTVGYDSPEAFEELLWRAFWPGKYLRDRIEPWQADDLDPYGEFEQFMMRHIRKLMALRAGSRPARYVSKNNANVARIPKIRQLFPDAVILVPFRNPVDHAGSMLRQHLRFSGDSRQGRIRAPLHGVHGPLRLRGQLQTHRFRGMAGP